MLYSVGLKHYNVKMIFFSVCLKMPQLFKTTSHKLFSDKPFIKIFTHERSKC